MTEQTPRLRRRTAVRTVASSPAPEVRPLNVIADEIHQDWSGRTESGRVNYAAAPYLAAMGSLDKITDHYYQDSAESIVRYFLANAGTWRGETARRIKAELKGMLK